MLTKCLLPYLDIHIIMGKHRHTIIPQFLVAQSSCYDGNNKCLTASKMFKKNYPFLVFSDIDEKPILIYAEKSPCRQYQIYWPTRQLFLSILEKNILFISGFLLSSIYRVIIKKLCQHLHF